MQAMHSNAIRAAIRDRRKHDKLALLFRCKRICIVLLTHTISWIILLKDSLVPSACSLTQLKGFVVAMLACEEVGKTVHVCQRV
jgi:hypothetical protein